MIIEIEAKIKEASEELDIDEFDSWLNAFYPHYELREEDVRK